MKLNSYTLAALIIVLLFGGIGFTGAMNWWQTESNKVPVKYAEGEAAGEYNPADIRGSYTFGEVSDLFDVPLDSLAAAFRLPADANPAEYPLKSLETQFADLEVEMGTGSVRMFVAFYKGLPYELSEDEDTYLFPEAAEILKAQNAMLPEQASYLQTHIVGEAAVEIVTTPEPTSATGAAVEATEHVAPDRTVTGKTTFQNLLDWGVTQETIETIMGETMPAPGVVIKDYLSQKGLEFSSLKTSLQAEVDRVK